jgi:UTP--glucose-1-phosphate uridylyltransferase
MSIPIAVVPVAGRGTRLLPLTKSQPKEMLPLGRKPTVQHVVQELVQSGVEQILFITGPGKAAIENHFDIDTDLITSLRENGKEELLGELDFERAPVQYYYSRQRRQLGLGHAILCAEAFVGNQPFLVALGDSLIGLDATSTICQRMVTEFESSGAEAVIAFQEVPREDVVHYGIANPRGMAGDVFELQDLIEKPSVDEAPSNLAVAARYICQPTIFEMLKRTQPGKGGEIQLTDAFRLVLGQGGRILGLRLGPSEHRYDVGNFASYYQAFIESALSDPQCGGEVRRFVKELIESEA